MATQKEVKVKVATDTELQSVEALESKIQSLKKQKLDLKIQTNQNEIANIDEQIAKLKNEIKSLSATELDVRTNTNEINKLIGDIEKLEGKKVDLNLDIEKSKLDIVKSEVENLDGTSIDVDVNNISAMEAVDQISQGFDRLKQGASGVGQVMGDVLESAGKQETNKTFLANALNDSAKTESAVKNINDIVSDLPGDDTALQGLLSNAVAMEPSLANNKKLMTDIANSATDYFAGMSFYGKSAVEAQQDMTNYLLTGNTAELERSPILSAHIDKLKQATTLEERQQVLAEALNETHWAGMGQADTYNNKLETFNGMLERGKYNLGGMFQEGAKWGMGFLINLDEATGGLVGMGIALGSFASPLTDTLMGLGQMATGMKAIKDLGFIKWLQELELFSKLAAAGQWLLNAAEQAFNFILIENPIIAVVMAIMILIGVLIWAYYNVDWFREMVDNAFASLVQIGQIIYSYVAPVIQWLSDLFNNFTSQIGLNTNDWIQAVLGFILFIPQLPLQLSIALVNALARVLGFKGNFVQSMISAGANAINGFINYIRQLPGIVLGEFNRVLGLVNNFINTLPSRVWDMGVAIIDALKKSLGIGSPGHMFYMIEGEFNRIDNLTSKTRFDTGSIGQDMVDSFNPDLSWNSLNDVRGINPASNGGDFIINVYGDVDSEKRVHEIVEAVRRELSFNNATAGRTV